jgi:fatty-acyl-CoA synthase
MQPGTPGEASSARCLLLDRFLGPSWPDLSTRRAVEELEAIALPDRLRVHSTYEALRLAALRAPGDAAVMYLPEASPHVAPHTLSYREFLAAVTACANAFHTLGVGATDVVSLLLPLLPESLVSLFGAQAAGIVSPVNPLLEPHQLAEILRANRSRVVVLLAPEDQGEQTPANTASRAIWDKFVRIRAELPDLRAIVAVDGKSVADGATIFDFHTLLALQPTSHLVSGRAIGGDDIAGYFHTGGTTGTPKLVRHTHLNQLTQAWVVALMLRIEAGERMLFGLPLYHVGGALTQALAYLCAGATLVTVSSSGWRNPAAVAGIWKLVERYRPCGLLGVPTVLAAALTVARRDEDISCLRMAVGGGSAIPLAVGKAYTEQFHLQVLEVYGMTETASIHTMSYADRPIRLGSVGQPVPFARVRIVRQSAPTPTPTPTPTPIFEASVGVGIWQDCEPEEIGLVAMAGPGVFSGYLDPVHQAGAFIEPGWVNSGDLGRIDKDGYLWITGRAKDLVIRGGHNIDPQPIEEILFAHPGVELAAVVGQPDPYAGELPVAYVQPKPTAQLDAAELIAWIRERTPERAAVPVAIHPINPMPLTGVGKIFKPALRWDAAQRVAAQLLADLSSAYPESLAQMRIIAGAHPVHGNLIRVQLPRPAAGNAELLAQEIDRRLSGLTIRHAIVWE